MIEFIREIHKMFYPISNDLTTDSDGIYCSYGFLNDIESIRGTSGFSIDLASIGYQHVRRRSSDPCEMTRELSSIGCLVSFEMFHRVAMRTQYSLARRHSRILWILISLQLAKSESSEETMMQFLPVYDVCRLLPDLYLQSVDYQGMFLLEVFIYFIVSGFTLSRTESFESIKTYKGENSLVLV